MTRSGPVLAAAIAFLAATPVAAGDEACVACLSNVRPGGELQGFFGTAMEIRETA